MMDELFKEEFLQADPEEEAEDLPLDDEDDADDEESDVPSDDDEI